MRSLVLALGAALLVAPALAQTPRPGPRTAPPKKPPVNQTRGQSQVTGGDGQFGVTYSFKNGLNIALLAARYTDAPHIAYSTLQAGDDQKLVVVDLAVKNAVNYDNDHFGGGDGFLTLVDASGAQYSGGSLSLESKGIQELFLTLKPGQGVGQPDLHDPLRLGFVVPAKARIVKIIANQGRLNKAEEVLRYYIAGATKAEAGEPGDPKNPIAHLPEGSRDPTDPHGATALPVSRGTKGVFLPSGLFAVRLDSVAYSDTALGPVAVEEGKKLCVLTLTLKNLSPKAQSRFDALSADTQLTDADGEKYTRADALKARRDESAGEGEIEGNGELTVRVVVPMPRDAAAKTFTFWTVNGRKIAWDVAAP